MPRTTCDIFLGATKSGTGVRIILTPAYAEGLETTEPTGEKALKYTHTTYVSSELKIWDAFNFGAIQTGHASILKIPDENGTEYIVIYRQVSWYRPPINQPTQKLYLRRKSHDPTDELY